MTSRRFTLADVSKLTPKMQQQVAEQLYGSKPTDRRKVPRPVAEQAVCDVPTIAPRGEAAYPGRVLIRITSVRKRLIDPDNLVPKYFVDCCKYAGLVRGDSASEVEILTTQRLPAQGEEEHTLIDISPITQQP